LLGKEKVLTRNTSTERWVFPC